MGYRPHRPHFPVRGRGRPHTSAAAAGNRPARRTQTQQSHTTTKLQVPQKQPQSSQDNPKDDQKKNNTPKDQKILDRVQNFLQLLGQANPDITPQLLKTAVEQYSTNKEDEGGTTTNATVQSVKANSSSPDLRLGHRKTGGAQKHRAEKQLPYASKLKKMDRVTSFLNGRPATPLINNTSEVKETPAAANNGGKTRWCVPEVAAAAEMVCDEIERKNVESAATVETGEKTLSKAQKRRRKKAQQKREQASTTAGAGDKAQQSYESYKSFYNEVFATCDRLITDVKHDLVQISPEFKAVLQSLDKSWPQFKLKEKKQAIKNWHMLKRVLKASLTRGDTFDFDHPIKKLRITSLAACTDDDKQIIKSWIFGIYGEELLSDVKMSLHGKVLRTLKTLGVTKAEDGVEIIVDCWLKLRHENNSYCVDVGQCDDIIEIQDDDDEDQVTQEKDNKDGDGKDVPITVSD